MSTDSRHRAGALGEQLAADHVERLGYRVLARNARTRWGELDLVAQAPGVTVFVEVKTRRGSIGRPFDALDGAKRRQVRKMAAAWLVDHPERPRTDELRFDAIGVTLEGAGRLARLEHLEGAF